MGKTQERTFVMSYNGNNKRNFNNNRNNGNRNFNNRNNNRNNNQQYNKKQEIIAKQNANLDMIEAVAEYLDNDIANTDISNNSNIQKITMKEILNYLVNDKGFAQDDTKTVSQFNYIMMDLANAQRSGYVSGDRINIRILYIQERLKTSFKKELHNRIDSIMENYRHLFQWNDDNKSENSSIEVIPEEGTPLAPVVEEKAEVTENINSDIADDIQVNTTSEEAKVETETEE